MIAYIPNIITSARIVGTLCMIFTEPFSDAFFVIYSLTGLSDILDGFIARVTKTTSVFGAKLDSVADLLFYVAMFFMILPALIRKLPAPLWLLFCVVVLIRLVSYITAAARFRRFASTHSKLNKLTGAAVFSTPYVVNFTSITVPFCTVIGLISAIAAVKELYNYAVVGKM